MTRFQFRLERVLSVRRYEEEREKLLFGSAVKRLAAARHELDSIRDELSRAVESAAKVAASQPTIEELVRSYEYRAALLRNETRAESSLEERRKEYEQTRLKLIEARKRRTLLERLRERHFEDWRYDEEQSEQNELDEIGLMEHIRRGGEREAV